MIDKHVPENAMKRAIASKALDLTVSNIMARNSNLPLELVRKLVSTELANAINNGKLYTAKELHEIEERVYAQVNLRVSYRE